MGQWDSWDTRELPPCAYFSASIMRKGPALAFFLHHLPWMALIGGGIGWGLLSFERHVRADQHEKDMEMFRDWVRLHIDDGRAGLYTPRPKPDPAMTGDKKKI